MKIFERVKKPNGRVHFYLFGVKVFSVKISGFLGCFARLRINYQLRHCKYVHLMHTEKFTEPTIRFFNENFNPKEHLFLCALAEPYNTIPAASNCFRLWQMKGLNFNYKNIEKIICHGLFVPDVLNWLYEHPDISRQKCFWVIWGGDLYGAYNNSESTPNSARDITIRRNFRGYITAFDKQKACELLDIDTSKFYTAYVPCPITKEMIDKTHKEKRDYIQIQVNHSCNETTLEMLDILSKWKDKNIRIVTILSYGDMACVEEIKEKGKEIFGDKFFSLDNMVSGQEYTQFLAQNDILILNHDRQQGMGNAFAALNLGIKMFIKSDVSTYHFFHEIGIKIFDTYKIKEMSFEDFVAYPEKQENLKIASQYYDEQYWAKLWKDILNSN